MFDLKQPCGNCPFRKDKGRSFGLSKERIEEIASATAFQCHKTVNYEEEGADKKPQQCAGLIGMLHKSGRRPNLITQVARNLIGYDPAALNLENIYDSVEDAITDHAS